MDIYERAATRRRAPGWVRALDRSQLHGLTLNLRGHFWEGTATPQQEWLLDACISELEYRHRAALRGTGERPCCCELCLGPFGQDET